MWSVAVSCTSTLDEMLHSTVVEPKIKWCTLICVSQWPNDKVWCGTPYRPKLIVLLGPLNDLRESAIQFVKPRPLRNNINPGGRWNSNTTWDAREAMVPGSVYDRQNRVRTHDPMTRISAHMGNVPGMSVPMSMVMNNQFNKKPPQSKSTHR